MSPKGEFATKCQPPIGKAATGGRGTGPPHQQPMTLILPTRFYRN